MAFRKKMSKRKSKSSFRKGTRVKSRNNTNPMRGGIRL
ncbi:MAG: hypothetical protein [Arizlama microvirus]|nr:MAG: hypothetical protein [Arizlama microvirus]